MDKRSFKKHSIKEQDLFRERYNILDEKYTKIKEILKQVLAELRELKVEKQRLIAEQEKLVTEIKEKDELLERMQSVSEAVIDEYTALKVKCDLETEAANNAIKRATKYFQENQKLKKTTGHESESDIAAEAKETLSQESLDENVSELDVLNNLASELRTEIANLKIQLGKEIERQNSLKDDFEIARNLYEQEMMDHNCTKEKLQSLQLINSVPSLDDIESENYHHPNSLQSKQPDDINVTKSNSESHDHIENVDDITAKWEAAEAEAANYKQENGKLVLKIQHLESQIQKLNKEVSASDLLPIPPPPPPPPLPPPSFNPIKSLITFIHAGKKSSKAVKKESTEDPQQKAMSEMIDAIKKGNIQLKPTPKTVLPSPKKEIEETALGEMKNILASLKKKNTPCEDAKPAELQTIHEKSSVASSNEETGENFNIGSDIDDELKYLLRKQSIKIATNEDDELNIDSFSSENGKEIEKHLEFPLQEAATLNENKFTSNVFSINQQLSSENEKNVEISTQESVTLNENGFADCVNSDNCKTNLGKKNSVETSLQESPTSDKNQCVDNFISKSNRIDLGNETSLDIPLMQPTIETQFSNSVFSDDTKDCTKNEESFQLQESATENCIGDHVFAAKSAVDPENEKSIEILLMKPTAENQCIDYVASDKDTESTKEETDVKIPLQEPTFDNQPAEDFSVESPENENCLEIPFQESTAKNQADHIIPNNNDCMENKRSLEIPMQKSTTENQLAGHVFLENNKKSIKNEKGQGIPLKESATGQPDKVSDTQKSAEIEESLEIPLQESITSDEKQFTDSFLSNSSRFGSGNETVII